MKIRREIGEKGQVVIPKDIREFLGLKSKEKVFFEVRNDEVILKKEQDPKEFLKDFLDVSEKKGKGSIREIKKLIENQYEEEIP